MRNKRTARVENEKQHQGTSDFNALLEQESKEPIEKKGLDKVIDIKETTQRYRHFRAIRHGYMGLARFSIWLILYTVALGRQHHACEVGDSNNALQIFFEKLKADAKNIDASGFFNVLTTQVVPVLFSESWSHINENGQKLHGRVALDFFHVVGGVVLTAVKGPKYNCFEGQPCFLKDALKAPFIDVKLPGKGNETFSVPYNAHFGGYSIGIPSSTAVENSDKLLAACQSLYGEADTRELWVHAVLFNPSGQKTITSLAFGGIFSVHDEVKVLSNLRTIPHHLYGPGKYSLLPLVFELIVVLLFFRSGVWPYVVYYFKQPSPPRAISDSSRQLNDIAALRYEEHEWSRFRQEWLLWNSAWNHLPRRGAKPLWVTVTFMTIAFTFSIVLWIDLCFHFNGMGDYVEDSRLFVDPLEHAQGTVPDLMAISLQAMHDRALPLMTVIDDITLRFNHYFFVHVVSVTLTVIRLQQYLSFQKRLSMVADTFTGIFDDLLHMGIVLVVVCFLFGVINSLAFGAVDPAFQQFDISGWEMVLVCFGLFKPSATHPFVQNLFKYDTHVDNDDKKIYWIPLGLQIIFKTLVVLLLFKLLLGVIMESYKKHAKLRDKAPTVRQDLQEMGIALYHYVWRHKILGKPWVPFFHVALSLAQLNRYEDKEKPWNRYFLGLDHNKSVENCLNSVFSEQVSHRVQVQVSHESLQWCGQPEVEYVLEVYGTNRARAEALFTKVFMEQYRKKSFEKNKHEEAKHQKKKEAQLIASALDEVQTSLAFHRSTWKGVSEEDVPVNLLAQKKIFSEQLLEDIFQEYDIVSIGTVDHQLMPQLFAQLGFEISDDDLSNLLAAYDKNEDGDTSLAELKELVHDDRLVGCWKRPPRRSLYSRTVRAPVMEYASEQGEPQTDTSAHSASRHVSMWPSPKRVKEAASWSQDDLSPEAPHYENGELERDTGAHADPPHEVPSERRVSFWSPRKSRVQISVPSANGGDASTPLLDKA